MERYKGRILLSMLDTKSYAVHNGTELYYDQLRAAYKDLKEGSEASYLLFAFVTLCSATLEYSLNYLILEHCLEKYGPHNYKRYWNTYNRVQFMEKLYIVPTLLSDGRLVLNEDHRSIKKLEELIVLRNRILHNKEEVQAIETPDIGAQVVNDHLMIPVETTDIELEINLRDNPIESLNREMCMQFGEALGDFKTLIMTPKLKGTFDASAIVKERNW